MDERREKERIKAIREKHPHLVGDTLPHNHTIRELIDIAPFIESVQTTIQADITDGHDHNGSNSVKVDWGDLDNRPSEFPPEDHDHVKLDITDFAHTHAVVDITDWPTEFPPEDHEHVLDDITDYVEPEQGLRPSDLFGVGKEGYVIDPWELTANKGAASGYASLDVSSLVVQNPANAQTTAAASKIPISNASAKIDDAWIEPAGSTTQVQYNDAGALAGDANFTWDKTNKTLTVKGSTGGATLGSELLTNNSFEIDLSSWTAGAGWAWASGGKALHTAGSMETLSQSIGVTNGSYYFVEIIVSGRTAGSVTISINSSGVYFISGNSTTTLSSNATWRSTWISTTTGSVSVDITPTTDFNGSIDSVSIKVINADTKAVMSLKNSAGVSFMDIRGHSTSISIFGDGGTRAFGSQCYGIGLGALSGVTNATELFAIGYEALKTATSSTSIIAIGNYAARYTTVAAYGIAFGGSAATNNTIGSNWVAIGQASGLTNTTGNYWTAIGRSALRLSQTSDGSTAIGYESGYNTTGANNTYIGTESGRGITSGASSVCIGYRAGYSSFPTGYSATSSNMLIISNANSATPLIFGDFSTGLVTIHNDLKANTKFGLGLAPIATRAHVADPSGGATTDAEARTAINAILATLEAFGFHATS